MEDQVTSTSYAPPLSQVVAPDRAFDCPKEVTDRIRHAWIAGVISGCMTTGIALLSLLTGPIAGINRWALVDAVLVFALAFGIFRRSRTCALILLLYFIYAKISIIVESPASGLPGLAMGFVFAFFFFQGVRGTFRYHKLRKLAAVPASQTGVPPGE